MLLRSLAPPLVGILQRSAFGLYDMLNWLRRSQLQLVAIRTIIARGRGQHETAGPRRIDTYRCHNMGRKSRRTDYLPAHHLRERTWPERRITSSSVSSATASKVRSKSTSSSETTPRLKAPRAEPVSSWQESSERLRYAIMEAFCTTWARCFDIVLCLC